jgi:nicotinate phosphoribosyltransferase
MSIAQTDIARRVYNHTWKLDPIVRSLLDTDFYKLLMLQMIWGMYPDVDATFSLINRTTSVKLAEEIDEGELRAQLDHARDAALLQEGDDLARRQHLLWPQADLRAGVPRLAGGFPAAGIRAAQEGRPVRARLLRPVEIHDAVGDPGARHHQRAALARRDEGLGPFALDVLYARAKARCGTRPSG